MVCEAVGVRSTEVAGVFRFFFVVPFVFEGLSRGRLRSTQIDQGRDSVWAISRRPEACRSSGSHKIADLFMLYPVEAVAGLSSRKVMDFLAEDGSKFEDFFQRTSV